MVVEAIALARHVGQAAADVLGFVFALLQPELGLEPDHVGLIDQLPCSGAWNADQPDGPGFAQAKAAEDAGATHVSPDVTHQLEMSFVNLAKEVGLRLAVGFDVFKADLVGGAGVIRPAVEARLPHDLWAVILSGHCPAAIFSTVVWPSY